jgi:hypothetical protein
LFKSSKMAPEMVPSLLNTSTVKVWVSVPPRLSLTRTLKLILSLEVVEFEDAICRYN